MLIFLVLLFPPAWPFVLLYYLFGSRNSARQAAKATEQLRVGQQELLMATLYPGDMIRRRAEVAARASRRRMVWIVVAVLVAVICAGMIASQ